jgi:hypothetical protein
VLEKLLFFKGRWLRAGSEEYNRGEVLGGPLGNGHLVKVAVDVAAYFLCTLAHRSGQGHHAEFVVEPRSLLLERSLGFVKLVEMGTLPFAIIPTLWGPFASGSIR